MAVKNFKGALDKMTGWDGVLPGDKGKAQAIAKPFGERLRDELEQEAAENAIVEIPITNLNDNPFQYLARPVMDEEKMQELVNSIQQNGFYGSLLARRKQNSSNQYELAYGHRRKEAAKRCGLLTLPIKVLVLSNERMARIMASENFARADLAPTGEANVVGLLYTEQNLSITEITEIVGKGKGWVTLRLGLYNASQDIKDLVEQRPETLGHVRLLTQVENTNIRKSLIQEILQGKLTREQLQQKVGKPHSNNADDTQLFEDEVVKNITSVILYNASDVFHNDKTDNGNTMQGLESETPNSLEVDDILGNSQLQEGQAKRPSKASDGKRSTLNQPDKGMEELSSSHRRSRDEDLFGRLEEIVNLLEEVSLQNPNLINQANSTILDSIIARIIHLKTQTKG